MKKIWTNIKSFLRKGRAVIVIVLFGLYMTFVDSHNFIDTFKLKQELRELEQQKNYYREKIAQDSAILEGLKDDAFLEKYAREHFYMRRDGETIYVVQE